MQFDLYIIKIKWKIEKLFWNLFSSQIRSNKLFCHGCFSPGESKYSIIHLLQFATLEIYPPCKDCVWAHNLNHFQVDPSKLILYYWFLPSYIGLKSSSLIPLKCLFSAREVIAFWSRVQEHLPNLVQKSEGKAGECLRSDVF